MSTKPSPTNPHPPDAGRRSRRQELRLSLLDALGTFLPGPGHEPVRSLPPDARILLIRPDHIGDLLLATPAFSWLRRRLPEARLELLCGPWAREVVAHNPDLDEVLTLPFPGFERGPVARRSVLDPYVQLRRAARGIAARRYDAAFVLRFDHWWGAMLAHFAGIPRRVGYGIEEVVPFLSSEIPYHPVLPEPLQNLRLMALALDGRLPATTPATLPLRFPVAKSDQDWAAEWHRSTLGNARFAVIHPAAGAVVKQYEPESFAAVINELAADPGLQVVLSGTPAEVPVLDAIDRAAGHSLPRVVGASLGQLAALLVRAEAVIGVDSGVLHLAVAAGAPTVALYGPVDSRTFGPWGDPARHRVLRSDLPCVPCNRLDYTLAELPAHPCIRAIDPARIVAEVRSLLAAAPHAHRD